MTTQQVCTSIMSKQPTRTLPHEEHRYYVPGVRHEFHQTPSFTVRQVYRATCNVCGFKSEGSLEAEVNKEMWDHLQSHMFSGRGNGVNPRWDGRPRIDMR